MSARIALSEEQRQQAIVKLLAERRAREQAQPAHPSLSDSDRAHKVQQLILERTAAKLTAGRPHQGDLAAAGGAQEQQLAGEDLLSPSSTCSLQSQRHEQQGHAPLRHMPLLQNIQEADAAHAPGFYQHQQQSPHHCQQHQPLQAVLGGPVDVSDLWALQGGLSAQASSIDEMPPNNLEHHSTSYTCEEPSFVSQLGRPTLQQQQMQPHASQQRARRPCRQQPQTGGQLRQRQHRTQDGQQQQQQQGQSPQRRLSPPASPEQRICQLAQPKSANRHKYEQMRLEAELQLMQQCSFSPATGRGPQHRQLGAQSLPAAKRLYLAHAERQARLERRLAEQAASAVSDCTFKPATNTSANARHLGQYEYVPLQQRLGQVLRSKNEKLAAIQAQLEQEQADDATFAPRINPRSAALAMRRSSRATSPNDAAASRGDQQQQQQHSRSSSVDRSSRGRGLRKSRSEADMLSREAECSFTPQINSSSRAILQASGDIPAGFLQRQLYFERLAKEKKQLLQLAVEEEHCSFSPARRPSPEPASTSGSRCGSGDLSYLERLERLAYQDKRRAEASRAALAEQVHSSECTFSPQINPRSRRMVQATPLQELYENSKGKLRRGAVAAATEQQQQQECTFAPNLSKQGPARASPPQAKLSLSATEMNEVVARLHASQRSRQDKVESAVSFQQYQELKQCTFTPQITRTVPRQQEAVLVRGLGRFMELKAMARQQQQERTATEAKVFKTHPQGSKAPFTVPQPFHLGRQDPGRQQQRRSQAAAAALEAAQHECTFAPAINSSHRSRQERVKQLLQESES